MVKTRFYYSIVCHCCVQSRRSDCNMSRIIEHEMTNANENELSFDFPKCNNCTESGKPQCTSGAGLKNDLPRIEFPGDFSWQDELPHRQRLQAARAARGDNPCPTLYPSTDEYPDGPGPDVPEWHRQHDRTALRLQSRLKNERILTRERAQRESGFPRRQAPAGNPPRYHGNRNNFRSRHGQAEHRFRPAQSYTQHPPPPPPPPPPPMQQQHFGGGAYNAQQFQPAMTNDVIALQRKLEETERQLQLARRQAPSRNDRADFVGHTGQARERGRYEQEANAQHQPPMRAMPPQTGMRNRVQTYSRNPAPSRARSRSPPAGHRQYDRDAPSDARRRRDYGGDGR